MFPAINVGQFFFFVVIIASLMSEFGLQLVGGSSRLIIMEIVYVKECSCFYGRLSFAWCVIRTMVGYKMMTVLFLLDR